jgi:hypothetical protein
VPKYLIFPDPLDSKCELTIGNGQKLVAIPDTHSGGRKGQSFTLPSNTPQGNGAHLVITAKNKVTLDQNGILWYDDDVVDIPFPEGGACLFTDDFRLQNSSTNNIPVPPNNTDPNKDPFQIIMNTFDPIKHDLTTHDGCGKFTEDCCKALHEQHFSSWGHVKKTGAQEQYNGHAIDAVQILMSLTNAPAGIYDIIRGSQAPSAKPQFIRVDNANQNLWYYPA